MDPLSVIRAVASLITLAAKVSLHCYHFYDTYHDAKHDVAPTRWNIELLGSTLQDICKQSFDLHAKNRLPERSTMRIHDMTIRGYELFNGMSGLMEKYECMTATFRKKLMWIAHGKPKMKELGEDIADCRDDVSAVLALLIRDAAYFRNERADMNQTSYHANSEITIGSSAGLSDDGMLRGTVNELSDAFGTTQIASMRPFPNSRQEVPSSTSANAGSQSTTSTRPNQEAEERHNHIHSASREFQLSEARPRRSDTGQSSMSANSDYIQSLKWRNAAAFSQQDITTENPFTAPGSPSLGSEDLDTSIRQSAIITVSRAADIPFVVSPDGNNRRRTTTPSSVHQRDALSDLRNLALHRTSREVDSHLNIITSLEGGPYTSTFPPNRPIHEPPMPDLRGFPAAEPDFRHVPVVARSESVEEWDLSSELESIGIFGDINLDSASDAGVDSTRSRFHRNLADELFSEGQDVNHELAEVTDRRGRMRKKAATW